MRDEAAPPTRERCRILSAAGARLRSLPPSGSRFQLGMDKFPLPCLVWVPHGTVVLGQAELIGFLAPSFSALCLPLSEISPVMLLDGQTRIFLLIVHIFPSANHGCFTKVSNFYTQNPFLLFFFLIIFFFPYHSTPSAASPASPAPTPARLQSFLAGCSSPPSP